METFVVHPGDGGPFPAVVLYMDVWGIREELRDIARRIATVGYYCVLPDLYYRQGKVRTEFRDANNRMISMDRLTEPQRQIALTPLGKLTDDMVISIAVQASVPILELGITWYRGWRGVVIYPGEFVIRKEVMDEDGVVHNVREEAAGEAWEHGPVILSWQDIELGGALAQPGAQPYNVVMHEFAHKLDMLNGEADGLPASVHQHGLVETPFVKLPIEVRVFCLLVRLAEQGGQQSQPIGSGRGFRARHFAGCNQKVREPADVGRD